MPMIRPPAQFRNADPEGGGGGTAPTPEEIQARIDAAVEAATAGLKGKNQELLGKLGKFKGADPDAVQRILAAIGDAEEAEMLKAGNIDGVVDRRVTAMREQHEQQLATIKQRAEAQAAKLLRAAISEQAARTGAPPHTVELMIYRAEAEGWTVDDQGEVVQRRGGETVFGKDGRTPLRAADWLEAQRTKTPEAWGKAQGAGASGGDGAQGTKAFKDLSEAERSDLFRKNPDEFRRQAAATNAT